MIFYCYFFRCECTPAYSPPEVLKMMTKNDTSNEYHTSKIQYPTAVDSWALGCVSYFCLSGRPLFYGDMDQVILNALIFLCNFFHLFS
jgi:serine/threonine protein kinase